MVHMFRILLVALLILPVTIEAQKKAPLGSRAKSDLKKQLTKFQRAKTDEAKEKVSNDVFKHGRQGIQFLETLTLKEDKKAALAVLKGMQEEKLGLDILDSKEASAESPWALSFISFDEIVLLKKDDIFAGFAIHETPDLASGTMTYSWWYQKGKAKKLNQPGGTKKEKQTATGTKAVKPFKPNAGYDEFDFELVVGNLKVNLRFVGPAYFLLKKPQGISYSFSGGKKPASYSNSDQKIKFLENTGNALARLDKQLPKYVFRVVPGAEPLNISEADQGDFAQYEAVQIEIRRTRLTSELILLIRFAEPDAITFEPHMPRLIANFVREILPIKDQNIMISRGAAPSYEANEYFIKNKWVPAKGPIKKFLRANFPEDY